MYKILLLFWRMGELGILLSIFTNLYQNSGISWTKVLISDFQSQFFMSKIIRISLKNVFIQVEGHIFCNWHFIKNSTFNALYLVKLGPFFVSWFTSFGKRYGHDLRVIFHQWPKLCLELDVEADIQI